MAAYALHAQRDGMSVTEKARAAGPGSLDYWERKVDPEGQLDLRERARRAEYARKNYFSSLALKSAIARRTRKERRTQLNGQA
jgi:hypothetical protein